MACLKNVILLGLCEEQTLNFTLDTSISVGELKERCKQRTSVDWSLFSLSRGGIILDNSDTVGECDVTVVHAHSLLKGGKGGFGSLIRAMGSQINKSTNKEACRNLTGRRVRDINAEKKLAKWAAEEPERRKKEAEEKRQRLERKRAGPRHTFDDTCYMEQIKSTEEEMGGALKQGLEASAGGSGRGKSKAVEIDRPCKRPKLWLGVDEDLSDSENEADSREDLDSPQEEEDGSSEERKVEGDSDPQPSCSHSATKNESSGPDSSLTVKDSTESAQTSSDDHQGHPDDNGEEKATVNNNEPVELSEYESAEALLSVGGERLKTALQALGLKCGGTPKERATRLFSTKGKTKEQLDPSLFAKSKKSKRKHK